MSAAWEREALLTPIAADKPCGDSLEDTELLASFDTYRLFGQSRPLDAPAEPDEKRVPKPPESPEWAQIRDRATEAIAKSKDLRLLATLGTALLRTNGAAAFGDTLEAAAGWLETWWTETYPRVDEDAILRRNALNCFADPMAVVDALRRVPLVANRQYGKVSLRDIDLATRQLTPGPNDVVVDENHVKAAFGAVPIEELTALQERVTAAGQSLRRIDTKMRDAAGSDATPNFDPLSTQLTRLGQVLRTQLAAHPNAPPAPAGETPGDGQGTTAVVGFSGGIASRQDAIRALDAVAEFFKRTEPSSPVPLFCARAKRLVSADFLDVLADIVPDAVPQARAAGGLKNE